MVVCLLVIPLQTAHSWANAVRTGMCNCRGLHLPLQIPQCAIMRGGSKRWTFLRNDGQRWNLREFTAKYQLCAIRTADNTDGKSRKSIVSEKSLGHRLDPPDNAALDAVLHSIRRRRAVSHSHGSHRHSHT